MDYASNATVFRDYASNATVFRSRTAIPLTSVFLALTVARGHGFLLRHHLRVQSNWWGEASIWDAGRCP